MFHDDYTRGVLIGSLVTFIVCVFINNLLIKYVYKKAQIDAVTGSMVYELVTQHDSSRVWTKKE